MITKDDVKNLKERLHYYNKFDFYRQKYIVKCEIKMAHAAEQKMNCLSCMTCFVGFQTRVTPIIWTRIQAYRSVA